MKRIQVWSVEADTEGRVRALGLDEVTSTETEQRLEELLVASPELLLEGLLLIARQLPSEAGILDLLGLDRDGRLVLLELKRGTLTRDAVAQILDYVAEVAGSDPDQLSRLIEGNSGRNGVEKIEDFTDWYTREFPDSDGPLAKTPRMVLVGLGVDERAKRIVNFLADRGIDIQLLTFHAFHSGGALLLARQVETSIPASPQSPDGAWTKEGNRRILLQLANQQGVQDLLKEVADFIEEAGRFYRWPGKTAYSFSLQGRSYLTLYVNQKKRGSLLLTLAPRVLESSPAAVERLLTMVSSARRKKSSWAPVEIEIDARSWPTIRERLQDLVANIIARWQFPRDQVEIEEERTSLEAAENAPAEEPAI